MPTLTRRFALRVHTSQPLARLTTTLLALLVSVAAPVVASNDVVGTVAVVAFDEAGASLALEVHVGDQVGTTPVRLLLPAGRHAVSVVIDGVRQPLTTVDLAADGFVDVVIDTGAGPPRADVDRSGGDGDPADQTPTTTTTSSTVTETGTLRLQVRSVVDSTPLGGARVFLRGGSALGTVADDGTLTVTVPAGAIAISVVQPGFLPRVVEVDMKVDVGAGTVMDVEVGLLPLADELDELTVRAPHIQGGLAGAVSERRDNKQLVEVLGAEQIKKSGDGDAASALRRVTGLTVVGGRFVYVRGLGDRYSSTLVNGAVLPSPEPEKRVVPLDQFPAPLLESLVVQKTWSPELPGEFGGGSVQLRTRSSPGAGSGGDGDKPLITVGVSTSMVLGTTFVEHDLPPGGALDVLGFDDGSRGLPADVLAASDQAPLAEGNALTGGGLDRKELERLGEQITPQWSPRQALVLPGLGFNATVGDTVDTPLGQLGAIAALTWSGDTIHTDASRQLTASGSDGDVVVTDDLRVASTERSVAWGTVLGLNLTPAPGQHLHAVTLLNRSSDDEARIVEGYDQDIDGQLRLTRLRFVSRQLFVQQVFGEHDLPWSPLSGPDRPMQLRFRGSYALAQRDEPGQRTSRFDQNDDGQFLLSDRSDGTQILTSSLVDHAIDTQLAVTMPFVNWAGEDGSATAGVALAGKIRDVDTRRFKFLFAGPAASDPAVRARPVDEIFTPATIGPDGFVLTEATRNTDNHTGTSAVAAGFVAVELPVARDVVVSGGLRLEASRLEVTTFELFNAAAAPVIADLTNLDVLPAVAVAWTMLDDLTLKAAATRTVVRPELRELSPAIYTDVAGGRARFGNPDLRQTAITHVDARLEWAFSGRDGASIALFGKHFDQPIESVVTAGADQAITADNVDAAFNLGVELEGRVSLAQLLPQTSSIPVLSGLWVGGNGALIASRVVIGAEQQGTLTSTERPLEGQSPWVANLQLGSDDDVNGFSVTALYNVFGPRIVEVGALGLPDAVEEPFHQLDVVLRQRLPWGLSLSLKGSNLLDLPATRTLGGRTVDSVSRGRAVSAGLSWTW